MKKLSDLIIFLGISKKTWYNWRDDKRPLFFFITKYINNEDIKEFLETNEIKRFELLKEFSNKELEILLKKDNLELLSKLQDIKKLL